MFKQYLEQITDVGIYPMFSLLVFFVFFTALIVYVVKANKEELNEISKLPLSNDETNKDRKSTRLNSSHIPLSRMPSSA